MGQLSFLKSFLYVGFLFFFAIFLFYFFNFIKKIRDYTKRFFLSFRFLHFLFLYFIFFFFLVHIVPIVCFLFLHLLLQFSWHILFLPFFLAFVKFRIDLYIYLALLLLFLFLLLRLFLQWQNLQGQDIMGSGSMQ